MNSKHREKKNHKWWFNLKKIITAQRIIVLITAVLAWLNWRMVEVSSEQIKLSREAIDSTSKYSRINIQNAVSTDRLTKDFFETQNRAYVTMANIEGVKISAGKDIPTQISFAVYNSGNTPAFIESVKSNWSWQAFPKPNIEIPNIAKLDSGTLIVAHDYHFVKVKMPSIKKDFLNIDTIYFAIIIAYKDIFDKSHRAKTYGAYFYTGNNPDYVITYNEIKDYEKRETQ